ncbi:MAG TPA: FAD-dependent oxidoreductase [Burkholderiaceae bacterium]|nr:FAD-dependent oxidoreductase [Burkholderiaceae bacterium]
MSDGHETDVGPDLRAGIASEALGEGTMVAGHVGGDPVLLARVGAEIFAIDGQCSHYHAPLADGLLVGGTVRCPWHHACFDLRTGAALRAPALDGLACWDTKVENGRVIVLERRAAPAPTAAAPASATHYATASATSAASAASAAPSAPSASAASATADGATAGAPRRVVIVGGGAAALAAAQRLRELGYAGALTMLSEDDTRPVDRPNLSKDNLAGTAPEDWIWLRDEAWFAQQRIDLRLDTRVTRLDTASRQVVLGDGSRVDYDRLLLATGAEPVRLETPGATRPHVHTLRRLADTRAIVAQALQARSVVVIGASFIGLEAAASLRTRGLQVHVVAPEGRPMERVLGPELGDVVRKLHEEHGVTFHLGDAVTEIEDAQVRLESGGVLPADLVVVGVGVRPRIALAQEAGLAIDRGVTVDAFLETSVPGVYAAGDIARWPDPHTGDRIRVEHWVVAQRQGRTAAENLLGRRVAFDAVPFFWSQHYDVQINYVGHAEHWDEILVDGDLGKREGTVRLRVAGRDLAVATIARDVESLQAEVAMERPAG